MPMAGDDIFVLEDDLSAYKTALVDFWNEFVALVHRERLTTIASDR
jgi:hypothetical protein